jgi:hypothetical protein
MRNPSSGPEPAFTTHVHVYSSPRGYARVIQIPDAIVKRDLAAGELLTFIDDDGILWVWIDEVHSGGELAERIMALIDVGCPIYVERDSEGSRS